MVCLDGLASQSQDICNMWQFWILTKVYFLLYIQMTVIFIGKTCNVFRNPPPTIMQLITALITYHVMSGSKAK